MRAPVIRPRQLIELPGSLALAIERISDLAVDIRSGLKRAEPEARELVEHIRAMRAGVDYLNERIEVLEQRFGRIEAVVVDVQQRMGQMGDDVEDVADRVPEGPIHKLKTMMGAAENPES